MDNIRGIGQTLQLAGVIALQEFRGKIQGFTIFVLCLALGVMSVVAVRSMTGSVLSVLERDGKLLVGGDISISSRGETLPAEAVAWLKQNTAVFSEVMTLRTLALRSDESDQVLINLQEVDQAYPLYGEVLLEGGAEGSYQGSYEGRGDGLWIAKALSLRLRVDTGDELKIGLETFRVVGVIESIPDRNARFDFFGSRAILGKGLLEKAGLLKEGSLVNHDYRIILKEGEEVGAFLAKFRSEFPDNDFEITSFEKADPNIEQAVRTMEEFMTLIALTIMLIGGIGIGNAARSFLGGRLNAIATLKSMGASRGLVVTTYLLLLLFIGLIGSIAGSVLGAGIPFVLLPALESVLPLTADPMISASSIGMGVLMGLVIELIFVVISLSLASKESVSRLFRYGDGLVLSGGWREADFYAKVVFALAIAFMLWTVFWLSDNERVAVYFIIGVSIVFVLFYGCSHLLLRSLQKLPSPQTYFWDLALRTLYRPGNMTVVIFMSLGIGFSVLSSIGMIQGSVQRQIDDLRTTDIPSFFLVDVQEGQFDSLEDLLKKTDDQVEPAQIEFSPIIRGRITAFAGRKVEDIEIPSEFDWVVEGDRAFTWDDSPSFNESNQLVEGDWWQEGYEGEMLLSFDTEAADAFGVGVGDVLSLRVLGRDFQARIANLRQIKWESMQRNFLMIFPESTFRGAPVSYIGVVQGISEDASLSFERELVHKHPNITPLRVSGFVAEFRRIFTGLSLSVQLMGIFAILSGLVVLAGVILANHEARVGHAIIFKVVGLTRWEFTKLTLVEYGLLGLLASMGSIVVGLGVSYFVVSEVMNIDWYFSWFGVYASIFALLASLTCGGVSAWMILQSKVGTLIRNE